jgi:hypothetical protein
MLWSEGATSYTTGSVIQHRYLDILHDGKLKPRMYVKFCICRQEHTRTVNYVPVLHFLTEAGEHNTYTFLLHAAK